MSDRLDERIRELFTELDAAAPQPPPRPRVPVPQPGPRWARGLSLAAGVTVVVLVIGIAGQFLRTDSDDAGTLEEAPITTQAEAEAAEATPAPAESRPSNRPLALAGLNLACSTFVDGLDEAIPTTPSMPDEFGDALTVLQPPVADLVAEIVAIEKDLDDPTFGPIAEAAEQLEADLSDAVSGPVTDAPSAYAAISSSIGDLGTALEDYGALDCSQLTIGLP